MIETLADAGVVSRRPLAVASFTNEEGARFQPDMFGSLVFTGGLPLEKALATVGVDGANAGEELRRIGYAGDTPVGGPDVYAYVDCTSNRGRRWRRKASPSARSKACRASPGPSDAFGPVEPRRHHADADAPRRRLCRGGDHAFARRLARDLGGDQVATVGALTLTPNLVNVVAERAVMTVDLRDPDNARLMEAERRLATFVAGPPARRKNDDRSRALARFHPVTFAPPLVVASRRSRRSSAGSRG